MRDSVGDQMESCKGVWFREAGGCPSWPGSGPPQTRRMAEWQPQRSPERGGGRREGRRRQVSPEVTLPPREWPVCLSHSLPNSSAPGEREGEGERKRGERV